MKQEKKSFKQKFQENVLKSGEFYVKLCFTILFATIFIIVFVLNDGYRYFYPTAYENSFKGQDFQVHIIDVGKGDCILIKLPTNQTMLIDTGEEEYSQRVCEYIQQFMIGEGIKQIDYFFITHPDSDHIGGAVKIMKSFEVVNFLRPPVTSVSEDRAGLYQNYGTDDSVIYDEVVTFAYDNDINMQFATKGLSLDFLGCRVDCLSPTESAKTSSNNYSIVLMIEYQGRKFLFMGDCESSVEGQLISEYGTQLQADVLKVAHHGSATSSSQSFIDAVSPKLALICTDGQSSFFPNAQVLERLEGVGAKILSTAKMGSIVLSVEKGEVVYASVTRTPNFLALVFACLLVVVLVVWENPIKKVDYRYFVKKER